MKKIYLFFLAFSFLLYQEKKSFGANSETAEFLNGTNSSSVQIIDGLPLKKLDSYEEEANQFEISFSESKDLFPKINFKNSGGNMMNLKDFRGNVVVLHFWASWCGHCVHEMLDLNQFSALLDEKEISGIKIIPISVDDNFSLAKEFYERYGINNLDLFFDEGSSSFNSLRLSSLPKTFIIDKNGKLFARLDGAISWSKNSKILNQLKNLL